MQNVIVGGVIGGIILVGGWYVLSADSREAAQMQAENAARESAVMMKDEVVPEADMMKKDEVMAESEMMKKDDGMAEEEMMKKEETMNDSEMMKKDEVMKDTMMDDVQKLSAAEAGMEGKVGMYAPYAAEKLAMATQGDVVLFFKASWCPSCRALDANLRASLADIPAGLTILEVDYDTALALRQEYGVTTQHTLVQVDAQGTLIKKWSGGSTLASIVAEVK